MFICFFELAQKFPICFAIEKVSFEERKKKEKGEPSSFHSFFVFEASRTLKSRGTQTLEIREF